MDPYLTAPYRENVADLVSEFKLINQGTVVAGLMQTVSGLLAVLNEQFQVIAINDAFLQVLGVRRVEEVLGLRLGETLRCVHAMEEPAGCCTTKFCESCGAAIALVASLAQKEPAERICALRAHRNGEVVDVALLVRAHAVRLGDFRFILVHAQDITQQQRLAALEQTFFHDVNNLLLQLSSASELLVDEHPSDLAVAVRQTVQRLSREVDIQRCLSERRSDTFKPAMRRVPVRGVMKGLRAFFARHPAARGKTLRVEDGETFEVTTDETLLHRVLNNMVVNALEASAEEEEVRVWVEREAGRAVFCVRNARPIPEAVALRIFQRNFSTKAQAGRGIGTYSMKLFGETFLGGKVSFTSVPEQGTVFRLALPA